MTNKPTNPRAEIVSLLRGYFVCPIIVSLGKTGGIEILLRDKFQTHDMPYKNTFARKSILDYLLSLDLIENFEEEFYRCTKLGRPIFRRWGSFALLYSYRDMLMKIDDILAF